MKTALFFGSFNPIHVGHLSIAQYIVNNTPYKHIKFIVSPHNPLKSKDELLDVGLRLDMVKLSIADNPNFEVSDIELSLPTPSFTYQTIVALGAHKQPEKHPLIMGSDSLTSLPQWQNVEQLLLHPILVYKRQVAFVNPFPNHPNIQLLPSPILDISSTQIRQLIKERKEVKYLVRDEIINLLKLY